MSKYAIEISNLEKTYSLDPRFKLSFLEKLSDTLKGKKEDKIQINALKNINLQVEKGEVLGIIGDNGSGKSTLLKIISGITQPSKGSIKVNGRVASILEIGTGFHPELTGKENIYFGGSLLGLSKEEIDKVYDDIVDFSELNDFIDIQIKFYSSGMFMRLAFAVISHMNADIFLLDEVFSVGDSRFRLKSQKKIIDLKNEGKTILFVSHNLTSVKWLCDTFIHLENGQIKTLGKDINVITNYLHGEHWETTKKNSSELASEQADNRTLKKADSAIAYSKNNEGGKLVSLINDSSNPTLASPITISCYTSKDHLHWGIEDTIYISCEYETKGDLEIFPSFNLLDSQLHNFIGINPFYNTNDSVDLSQIHQNKVGLVCKIPPYFLNNGSFYISFILSDQESKHVYTYDNIIQFKVLYQKDLKLSKNYNGRYSGALMPKLEWELLP